MLSVKIASPSYSRIVRAQIRAVTEAGTDPVPAAVLMLDIRRGRPARLRMNVAKALSAHCVEVLGISPDRSNVEFTQHVGDEMFHPALDGYSPEWSADEQ